MTSNLPEAGEAGDGGLVDGTNTLASSGADDGDATALAGAALRWAARSNRPATFEAGIQGPSPLRTSVSGPILPSAACWTSSAAETGPNSAPIARKYHSAAIIAPGLVRGLALVYRVRRRRGEGRPAGV